MNINELLGSGAQVAITVTPADLKEFAVTIINETMAKQPEQKEEYLTPDQTASTLGVSKNTLWRWMKSGYLTPVKIGRKSVYKKSDITKLKEL